MNTAFGENDTVKVEHLFTLKFSDKWDKSIRKLVDTFVNQSYHYAESFRIVAMGMCAYFVMSGLAKLASSMKDDTQSRSTARSSTLKDKSAKSKKGAEGGRDAVNKSTTKSEGSLNSSQEAV